MRGTNQVKITPLGYLLRRRHAKGSPQRQMPTEGNPEVSRQVLQRSKLAGGSFPRQTLGEPPAVATTLGTPTPDPSVGKPSCRTGSARRCSPQRTGSSTGGTPARNFSPPAALAPFGYAQSARLRANASRLKVGNLRTALDSPQRTSSSSGETRLCHWLLIFLISIGLVACGGSQTQVTTKSPSQSPSPGEKDSNLTFFGVTLEQADEVGRPIWKVRAKQAKYTKEKQIGAAESPYGELYQDGKVVYQVQAQMADIEQDGKQLYLKGKIVAVDPRNGVVLHGNELEWRPKEDLLIVRNQLHGTHKQLQAVAQEARVKTREQRMEFSGGVVANCLEPQLQMRTEHLIWRIKEETLIGDRPVQMDHYKNNQITDRGRGDTAQVNLKTKIATVKKNAQIELLDPPVQVASNSMTWNFNSETVTTNSPVRVFHQAQKVALSANQGEMRIPQKTVYLTGNVYGVGERGQSLKSKTITWYFDKKLVEAQGDVVYRQTDPPLTFTGQKAFGDLQAETIVVNSEGSGKKVVTEIIPQERKVKN